MITFLISGLVGGLTMATALIFVGQYWYKKGLILGCKAALYPDDAEHGARLNALKRMNVIPGGLPLGYDGEREALALINFLYTHVGASEEWLVEMMPPRQLSMYLAVTESPLARMRYTGLLMERAELGV